MNTTNMNATNAAGGPGTPLAASQAPTGWRDRIRTAARYHVYAVAALPVGLVGLLATPLGGAGAVGRTQRRLARRVLGVPLPGAASPARLRVTGLVGFWLTSLPVNLLAFVLTAPFWLLFLTRGFLYPVFGANNLEHSWGGPTLAGAWLAHWIQGPPALIVITVILWPIGRFQARQAHQHLRQP